MYHENIFDILTLRITTSATSASQYKDNGIHQPASGVGCPVVCRFKFRGRKLSHMHTCIQILNPSTSVKTVITKLQNLFAALINTDIFQITLKFSLFTFD